MKKIKTYIQKFLERLSPEPRVAGLSITNEDIRYVFAGEKGEEKFSVRIPEGTMENGVVKNPKELQGALWQLHDAVLPKKKDEIIKVVVSLPPGAVYTQSLKVPYVGEDQLEESVRLNLQIVTPIRAEDAYMDWQKVKEFDNEIEILGAFIEKVHVENIKGPLLSAKFYPVALEFPAIAMMRMIKMKDREGIIMFVCVSNDGMDFFITKEGCLYFDYFISWKEIKGESKELSRELFDETLERETRKVSNFALSKAGKSIEKAVYIAPGMEARVESVLRKLGLKTEAAETLGATLGPLWYAAEGSGRRKDEGSVAREINIGGEGMGRAFFEERLIRFTRLWRNIGIGVMVVFLVIDGGMATLLGRDATEIEARVAAFKARGEEGELVRLEDEVKTFNALIGMVGKAREGERNWAAFLANLRRITEAKNIKITRIEVDGRTGLVSLAAEGGSHGAVIDLKNVLALETGIENVDLPLSKIAVTDGNNVTFFLSFKIKGE
ncbi:MAG: hypothetical protein Q8R20_03365 [Nanoarchaeota archaeon]|nr:hypothetical protein [Nanoarchaeota archaeon]